jgi:hypothetical protein
MKAYLCSHDNHVSYSDFHVLWSLATVSALAALSCIISECFTNKKSDSVTFTITLGCGH